jgi:hypothetical protein
LGKKKEGLFSSGKKVMDVVAGPLWQLLWTRKRRRKREEMQRPVFVGKRIVREMEIS